MKYAKSAVMIVAAALLGLPIINLGQAQQQPPALYSGPAIKGTMDIDFQTRSRQNTDAEGNPNKDVKDIYKVDWVVNGSVFIRGTIERQPRIVSKWLGKEVQRGQLKYKLNMGITKDGKSTAIADWIGTVVTDANGNYLMDGSGEPESRPRVQAQEVGNVKAFTEFFNSVIIGKNPQSRKTAMDFYREVQGKKIKYTAKNVDPMEFQNVKLAKGPLPGHRSINATGYLNYDYESSSFITGGITLLEEGQKSPSTLTGSMRWMEDPSYSSNGKGYYNVNFIIDGKAATVSEDTFVPEGAAIDEDAFFAVDPSKPGMTGTITYQDNFGNGGKVTSSKVVYDLTSNNTQKNINLGIAKLLLAGIGPINDD